MVETADRSARGTRRRRRRRKRGSSSGSGRRYTYHRTRRRRAWERFKRRGRQWARRALPVVLVGLVAVAVAGVFVAVQALDARQALNESRAAIGAAASAILDGDLERAESDVAAASSSVADARSATDGLLWSVADRVPLAGRSTRTVRGVVAVADASVAVISMAIERMDELFVSGSGLELRIDEGQVDLASIDHVGAVVRDLPVEPLHVAYERLVDVPSTWVPAQVREGRVEAIDLAAGALRTVDNARETSAILPAFLGAEGTRRYFVGMQTPAEIRGTGGLLGFYSILTVETGSITVGDPVVIEEDVEEGPPEAGEDADVAQRLGRVGRERGFVVPAPEDFQQRYEHVSAGGHFSNVNVDPHLPITADVLLSLYEHHTDERLDGAILMDPIALGALLEPVGPVEVDEELLDPDGRLPAEVAPEDVPAVLTHEIYEVYGRGRSGERRAFFRDFAARSFDAIFTGSWEGLDFVRGVADAASGRHLQVFSADEAEADAFARLGVAGVFGPEDGEDFLAVTANNAVGGKMDVHLGHRIEGAFELDLAPARHPHDRRATRRGTLRVAVDNPLPDDGMDLYIIGNCVLGQRGGCFEGPTGVNRTWFTAWTLDGTRETDARDDGGVTHAWSSRLHGLRAHDRYLETQPESEAWFELDLSGDVTLVRDGHELVYRLHLWRQSKAIPDLLDLTIGAPEGWAVSGVDLHGGEGRAAMGVHGAAETVGAEATEDHVRVRGAAASDVTLEIRFDRPLWDRAVDWLREPAF